MILTSALVALSLNAPYRMPAFDSVREKPLIGVIEQLGEDSVGQPTPKVIAPGEFWVAKPSTRSGPMRLRFRATGDLHAVILPNFEFSAFPARHGFGFEIDGRFIWPVRLTGSSPVRLHPKTWLGPYRTGHELLDVHLVDFGTTWIATVADGETNEVFGVATVDVPRASTPGNIALYAPPTKKPASSLELMHASQRPRCRLSGLPLGAGPWLTAVAAPETLSKRPVSVLPLEPTPTGFRFRADPLGLEQMNCRGLGFSQVTAELPWKYIDTHYLSWRGKPPSQSLSAHYKDAQHVETILKRWHAEHPTRTELRRLGTTHQGRPIWGLGIANEKKSAPKRSTLLFTGAHHGDELLTVDAVLDIGQALLEDDPNDFLLQRARAEINVWLVPMVNPDGNAAFFDLAERAGRKNGRDTDGDGVRGLEDGVDLNRNYPAGWNRACETSCARADPASRHYRGDGPASEPETQALMQLAERERFVASVSYHMGAVAVVLPRGRKRSAHSVESLAQTIANALGTHPSGERFLMRQSGPHVFGADTDWLFRNLGTQALLLEMHGWPPPADEHQRASILKSIRPAWRAVVESVLD